MGDGITECHVNMGGIVSYCSGSTVGHDEWMIMETLWSDGSHRGCLVGGWRTACGGGLGKCGLGPGINGVAVTVKANCNVVDTWVRLLEVVVRSGKEGGEEGRWWCVGYQMIE